MLALARCVDSQFSVIVEHQPIRRFQRQMLQQLMAFLRVERGEGLLHTPSISAVINITSSG